MIKLFLLKPGFFDSNKDNDKKKYFCPHCAMIEGVIKYYPQLEKMIEIQYVDFKKPRQEIIEFIGEENQSCPVLIIDSKQFNNKDISYFNMYGDKFFVNSIELIIRYFTENFGIGNLH
jgi:glutaredoxin